MSSVADWRQPPLVPLTRRALRRVGAVALTSPTVRRAYPARVTFPVFTALSFASARAQTGRWRRNVDFYHELLKYTPLAGLETQVARQSVAEHFQLLEVFWRPWLMLDGEIRGLEHLENARAAGRGVVAPFPHFGNPYAQFPIMHRHKIDAWVIAAPHHYGELDNNYYGRSVRQARWYVDLLGEGRAIVRWGPKVAGEGGFSASLRVLERGGLVSVAFDSVGNLATPLFGRQLSLASGAAKLACASGALVVPFVSRLRGTRPVLEFAAPLDPGSFPGPESLQAAVAGIVEKWALERPQAVWALETQPGGPPLINGPPLSQAPAAG